MKNFNWQVRFKSWKSWILATVAVASIVWTAGGFQLSDLDSWTQLGHAFMAFISKPVAIIAVVSALIANYIDPTTHGLSDTKQVMQYEKPRKELK